MRTIILILTVLMLFLLSCGMNHEDKAKLYRVYQDSIDLMKAKIKSYDDTLIAVKANLLTANDEMERIKEPQFLRTRDEREKQINNQSIKIQMLERRQKDVEAILNDLPRKIDQLNFDQNKYK